ncbi:hypothetical protein SCHPADRAFT_143911 [Schizopora paradoxa]|uniref:Uncharacterized protein n=1 Tax=Schizopora paradoxa TaxID=27342 RepID=A0A0H2S1E4_9AGAM|nr:hypothetical protein SCHPADRAFT_143911 [Schizopora paradoxa]
MDPTLCFDHELRTHFQCNNVSDALLARLLLTDGVEDTSLDLFISVINDPNFNPREVTFKRSGDILRLVAEQRQQDIDSLGNRSSQGMINVTAGVPGVVLDGVIDVLKDEFEDAALALRSRDGFSFATTDPPPDCFGFVLEERAALSDSRHALLTCCLVHTSWLGSAQRALGCALISPLKDLRNTLWCYIRSPLYSVWTRSVELKISCAEVMEGFAYLLSLFSRMPNVEFLRSILRGHIS